MSISASKELLTRLPCQKYKPVHKGEEPFKHTCPHELVPGEKVQSLAHEEVDSCLPQPEYLSILNPNKW